MRKDGRIKELQADHKRVYEEYQEVKQRRIALIRTLYSEGWTVEELLEAFQTTKPYLERAIPEAYEPKPIIVRNNWE